MVKNKTQYEKYIEVIQYIETHFKQNISITDIEKISYYSYRNINRIFLALHGVTVGKYIKRLRLEKAAEYLKYSDSQVYDIALEVGFSDIAAFSKAFKKKFHLSPIAFRKSTQPLTSTMESPIAKITPTPLVNFTLESLPTFEWLFIEYIGDFQEIEAVNKAWCSLENYCQKIGIHHPNLIYFSASLDDNEISEAIHCRYNFGVILEKSLEITPEIPFRIKTHNKQKYAKFLHKGTLASLPEAYRLIYANWLHHIQLEFADAPTLEFYLNHDEGLPDGQLLTEIYIPVI